MSEPAISSAPAVLQLISSSGYYGAERVVVELACGLRDQGWRCDVGALLGGNAGGEAILAEARRRGLRGIGFPCERGFDSRALQAIREYVSAHGIVVAHSHGYKSDILLYLSGARRHARLVATCHNWLTDSLKLLCYELADKLVLQHFDHVVAVSPPLARELAAAGIDEERRSLIENGLDPAPSTTDLNRPALRRALGVSPDERMLLTVGRLDPWKAYDQLLYAFSLLGTQASRARLFIVGDGPLREQLVQQAQRLGLAERVIFAGYRTDVTDLLRASDVFVLSSRKEGLPMVLLEAMAMRVPIAATWVGAIPTALEADSEAVLVAPEDPAALAAALQRLLSAPAQAQLLAERALQRYQQRYSRQAMGLRYAQLYRRLLEARGL